VTSAGSKESKQSSSVFHKPNVDDERESPGYVLMRLLNERGAEVDYYDPFVTVIKRTREHPQFAGRKSIEWNRTTIESLRKPAQQNCFWGPIKYA
jgi:UDP-N-acetyl-D-mannosaminuronate dehydrogenase